MRLSDFDYQLPKELIAQFPLQKRDSSSLLVLERNSGKISHQRFSDLSKYLGSKDSIILNDTKVIPARLFFRRKTQGKVEIFLLEKEDNKIFRCLVRPKKIRNGETVTSDNNSLSATILEKNSTDCLVEFRAKEDVQQAIRRLGVMPLPPYIRRQATENDRLTYQTVYAKKEGAVASPTAGLHFTKQILNQIKKKGTKVAFLTLHVGWGTFRPIRTEDITSHKMEEERFVLPTAVANLVNKTKREKGRVFCVGTTTTRVLEAVADSEGRVSSKSGKTDLFIWPGYKFKVVDCLLTNFHLPKSTLFLLVCAFAGRDLIFKAYQEAIKERYRFYSYGDAMLIK